MIEQQIKLGYYAWKNFKKQPFLVKKGFLNQKYIVINLEKKCKEWCGYNIPLHIENFWNEYTIVDTSSWETKIVKDDTIQQILSNG